MGIGTLIGQILLSGQLDHGLHHSCRHCDQFAYQRGHGHAVIGTVVAVLWRAGRRHPRWSLRLQFGAHSYALGGFFLVITWSSFFYAVFGVIVSAWLWASIAIFLKPIGMPVLTSTFVIVTWIMLTGQDAVKALVPVPPAEATNARRQPSALFWREVSEFKSGTNGCTVSHARHWPWPWPAPHCRFHRRGARPHSRPRVRLPARR